MLRISAFACLFLGLSGPGHAIEACVACLEPAKTYRCSVDTSAQTAGFEPDGRVLGHICEKVLAKKYGHKHCAASKDATKTCDGASRTVTLTDYTRALAANGNSTYDPGAHEVARHAVYSAWLCITSLFQDC